MGNSGIIFRNYESKCCHESFKREGDVTHYWVCNKCNKGCDLTKIDKRTKKYKEINDEENI